MSCPLCGEPGRRASWLGACSYLGKTYAYVECVACGSLYCDPMPDAAALARMYGPDYEASFRDDPAVRDPKEPMAVLRWLRRGPPGTFLDYGCGAGNLLAAARGAGWQVLGVEFDPAVAARTARRTGVAVVAAPGELVAAGLAPVDVLHLGDVIEHLTELDRQFPEVLQLVKPGGVVLAQGPLEANANLFTAALRVARVLRGRPVTDAAPYHVLLATAAGQRTFFRRFGLGELEYRVTEVAWPAPARLGLRDLLRPRPAGLFLLRKLSQAATRLRPGSWGNRYFYAGRAEGAPPA